MNKAALKSYAPAARVEFIQAVTDRAKALGLSAEGIEPMEVKGDVAIIAGQAFPKAVAERRVELERQIRFKGFEQLMEEVAYTWFNRFCALRFMEVHDYLDHGYRVLSNPSGSEIPEILEKATSVDLPGLDKEKVADLRLAGNKDAELYRVLLMAQCNALHALMPKLFEKVGDASELLLPENLLQTSSPLRKLVAAIAEEDWQEIEILGWLYQFYISEKKDQVIGKMVKSEDIPAATQLFTPNWIVKYMVQNTLGRSWMMTYPGSNLKDGMEFYITPAEQTPEVQAQLDTITPKELNPEELTLLDPACGSGHILVEAYDLFKAIYLERGFRPREIPRLILEKNLYGLDIDDRAVQLARFALLMKARGDDRRILDADNPVHMNVLAFQNSTGLDIEQIAGTLLKGRTKSLAGGQQQLSFMPQAGRQLSMTTTEKPDVTPEELYALLHVFEQAKTFGSLLRIHNKLKAALPRLEKLLEKARGTDGMSAMYAGMLMPLVQQARLLAQEYDCAVANPPYMGSKGQNPALKTYAKDNFPDSKADLFAMFMERCLEMTKPWSLSSLVTMQSWMFLSSYECLREHLLSKKCISSLVQIGYNSFPTLNSKVAQAVTFVILNEEIQNFKGTFVDLNSASQSANKMNVFLSKKDRSNYTASAADFTKIPGSPIAYWVTEPFLKIFSENSTLGNKTMARQGLATGDNGVFARLWHEVSVANFWPNAESCEETTERFENWYPYNKGGEFRRWYGNLQWVVNWQCDGKEIRSFKDKNGKLRSRPQNTDCYFKDGITWSDVTSGHLSVRSLPGGCIYDISGHSAFPMAGTERSSILAYLNSKFAKQTAKMLNPTLHFQIGDYQSFPYPKLFIRDDVADMTDICISLSRADWDSFETSWDFTIPPVLTPDFFHQTLKTTYDNILVHWLEMTTGMQGLEEENNNIFIDAYGLHDELTPDVPLHEITLTCNPSYRYGPGKTDEEYETLQRTDTMRELISYTIGCMMGRYSLDEPGLIYAHAGNEGFDPSRYATFSADEDGIIPVMDGEWFNDDATVRFVDFVRTVWPAEVLDENLKFVADSLDPKKGETSVETIRRFISSKFFKDHHLKVYKKRPIYWLFSSGKHKAFEALVYLHRYNENTLPRMRAAYVTPLQGKFNARIEYLKKEIDAASSTAARKQLQKELDTMTKKQQELRAFDELLRHYADQRITLDLDDGVKVNYGKFGGLLAEVKAITGGSED